MIRRNAWAMISLKLKSNVAFYVHEMREIISVSALEQNEKHSDFFQATYYYHTLFISDGTLQNINQYSSSKSFFFSFDKIKLHLIFLNCNLIQCKSSCINLELTLFTKSLLQ